MGDLHLDVWVWDMTDEVAKIRIDDLRTMMKLKGIPDRISHMFLRWVEFGTHPGEWGIAVLRGDLVNAALLCDSETRDHLVNVVICLHHQAPAMSWGDWDRVEVWTNVRGLHGITHGVSH